MLDWIVSTLGIGHSKGSWENPLLEDEPNNTRRRRAKKDVKGQSRKSTR